MSLSKDIIDAIKSNGHIVNEAVLDSIGELIAIIEEEEENAEIEDEEEED